MAAPIVQNDASAEGDAPYLFREFHGRSFGEIDLLHLRNYRIYLKLMIDCHASNQAAEWAVNSKGEVLGWFGSPGTHQQAFLYVSGRSSGQHLYPSPWN
jgi:hypothetical protein